jgi:hypothetical protein
MPELPNPYKKLLEIADRVRREETARIAVAARGEWPDPQAHRRRMDGLTAELRDARRAVRAEAPPPGYTVGEVEKQVERFMHGVTEAANWPATTPDWRRVRFVQQPPEATFLLLDVACRDVQALAERRVGPAPAAGKGDEQAPPDARHSEDFCYVYWFGHEFRFTTNQANAVEKLWGAWEKKTPVLRQESIIAQGRLVDVFKVRGGRQHAAWGTMIVCDEELKGAYHLQEPPFPTRPKKSRNKSPVPRKSPRKSPHKAHRGHHKG